jgi:maltose/moltooligosaccharide transporter
MAATTPTPSSGNFNKPALTFFQIWNMCFGFLGIQFGWALQMANMSAIFEHLGATRVAGLWLAAPLTGLIVQPIIGYLSDRTWHPVFGRRRPYFFIGAVLSSIALILMPNSSTLWMAAGLLWVLDASINISMEPFRAFVADKLPERQRTLGFTTQSFFIGVGAVLASFMPYILTNVFKVQNEAEGNAIPTSVKLSFYIGAAVFFSAVLFTILTTKEYPPAELGLKERKPEDSKGFTHGVKEIFSSISHLPKVMRQLAPVQFFTWMGLFCMWIFFGITIARSVFGFEEPSFRQDLLFESTAAAAQVRLQQVDNSSSATYDEHKKELKKYFSNPGLAFPAFLGISIDSLVATIPAVMNSDEFKDINQKITDNNKKPNRAQVSLASLVDSVRRAGVSPAKFIDEYNTVEKKKNDGVEWGGVCFAVYSIVTFLFAFLLPLIANRIGKKKAHVLCLIIGGLGLLSIYVIKDKWALFGTMTCVGIAWTSILSMPYAMLSNRIPQEKMGIYMGIFNFFIVIPEIISALSFDWILAHVFDWNRTLFVASGGILMLLAALLCLRVTESD